MRSRATVLLVALLLGGCGHRPGAHGSPSAGAAGEVVATYAGRTLTARDALERIEQLRPPARAYLTTPERKRGFVENMILSDLLYEEGTALGYAEDPAVTGKPEEFRKPLVVRRVMARYRSARPAPDDEVRRYYEANARRFVRDGQAPPFDRVRERIRVLLTNQRAEAQVRDHLETLKRRANLVISDAALARLDPLAGLVPPPAPPAAAGH
jgi:hypothetical protein